MNNADTREMLLNDLCLGWVSNQRGYLPVRMLLCDANQIVTPNEPCCPRAEIC